MPSAWTIDYWSRIGCHVFLSHSAEDRDRLVLPVYEELRKQQIIPWIDRHDYPAGRNSVEALREEMLRCRHVVYFVTSAMLRQGRGWPPMERTLASVVQEQVVWKGTEFQHFELPLLFVEPDHPVFQRSVWQPLLMKSITFSTSRARRESRRDWAARKIVEFVEQEFRWAEDVRKRLRHDDAARNQFAASVNLLRRIRAVDPAIIAGAP